MNNQAAQISLKALIALVFSVFICSNSLNAQDGEKLFKQNCAVCHSAHTDQMSTGPGLKGVFDRVPKGDWITKWIINNEKMIKGGDAYATKIYAQYGKAAMTVFEGQLNEKDVAAILNYIKTPPVVVAASGGNASADSTEPSEKTNGIDPLFLILGFIVVLIILLASLRSVRTSLQNSNNRSERIDEIPEQTFWQEVKEWIAVNRRLVGVFAIIISFIGMKSCWYACMTRFFD